jgi:hypothetical protein
MKFKVGDRVRYKNNDIGSVEYISKNTTTVYFIKCDRTVGSSENGHIVYAAMEDELQSLESGPELGTLEYVGAWTAKGTPAPKEPIPSKFYRTRDGDKVLYLGKDKHDYFIYQDDAGAFLDYERPFKYLFNDDSCMDIVSEWVDEVVLPAIEIKRWVVVYERSTVLSWHASKEEAQVNINKNFGADKKEIVELTGVLPERKV